MHARELSQELSASTGGAYPTRKALFKTSFAYFCVVFGCGFALGIVRTLCVVPRIGVRAAELIEMPLMLLAIVFAARWIVSRKAAQGRPQSWLVVGFISLVMMLSAELTLGMVMQGKTILQVFLEKDPVSGAAYYASLVVFAVMPYVIAVRKIGTEQKY